MGACGGNQLFSEGMGELLCARQESGETKTRDVRMVIIIEENLGGFYVSMDVFSGAAFMEES